jgi:ankyrin repeat protein
VRKEAEVNLRPQHGWGLFHFAALLSHSPTFLETLVQKGADVNARVKSGETALHFASRSFNPNPACIETLIRLGAQVNARDQRGNTPLHLAARHYPPSLPIIEALIRLGAEVNARDKADWTPLHWAAGFGRDSNVLLKLLELGADPRAHTLAGETAWDLIQHNQRLTNTPAFWRLNDLRF